MTDFYKYHQTTTERVPCREEKHTDREKGSRASDLGWHDSSGEERVSVVSKVEMPAFANEEGRCGKSVCQEEIQGLCQDHCVMELPSMEVGKTMQGADLV